MAGLAMGATNSAKPKKPIIAVIASTKMTAPLMEAPLPLSSLQGQARKSPRTHAAMRAPSSRSCTLRYGIRTTASYRGLLSNLLRALGSGAEGLTHFSTYSVGLLWSRPSQSNVYARKGPLVSSRECIDLRPKGLTKPGKSFMTSASPSPNLHCAASMGQ